MGFLAHTHRDGSEWRVLRTLSYMTRTPLIGGTPLCSNELASCGSRYSVSVRLGTQPSPREPVRPCCCPVLQLVQRDPNQFHCYDPTFLSSSNVKSALSPAEAALRPRRLAYHISPALPHQPNFVVLALFNGLVVERSFHGETDRIANTSNASYVPITIHKK